MVNMDTKSPLGELIESARKLADYSQQDVADRATTRGYRMSKQNVGRLVNDKPLASINAKHIKGIAAALGLSESRVAMAALASMGVDLGYAATPLRQAILDALEIDERTKRSLLAILSIDEQEVAGDGDDLAKKRAQQEAERLKAQELSQRDDTLTEVAHPTNTGTDLPPGESQGDDHA